VWHNVNQTTFYFYGRLPLATAGLLRLLNYCGVFAQDYPDYYEIIRRPIDMQKVLQRMTAMQYQTVDDMVTDFVLMFDNACKYNEPDSLIYKVLFGF